MNKAFLIAEIGQAHEGSLGIAHSYIDSLKDLGVDAVKFQTHIAAAESSIHEPFRKKFSYEDKKRIDYWKRMEFTLDQWKGLKIHCDEVGLEFISSPFSNAAVDLLEDVGINTYKVGSGEVTNFLLLEKIAQTGKPIILSSGMSSLKELQSAIQFIEAFGNELALLQCTTSYPTGPEELGLNVIQQLKHLYPKYKIGLSEHTGSVYAGLAAVALGAEILEFHVVFDKKMFGPDSSSSLNLVEVEKLSKGVRFIETAINHPIDKSQNSRFVKLKKIFEKSLAINQALPKGHILTFSDLEAKKPSELGIPAKEFRTVIGRQLNQSLNKWDFLLWEHLK